MKNSKISKMVYLWQSEDIKYMSPYTKGGTSVDFTSIFTRRVEDYLQSKTLKEIEEYYKEKLFYDDYIFVYES